MKKRIIFTATMAGLVLLTSCKTGQKQVSSSSIEGEWNITKIENTEVTAKPSPYIGFDANENRVYGNAGCNRIMGSFALKGNKGKIKLSQMASTMMYCPDMELEHNVLRALGSVERIDTTDAGSLVLSDKNNKPLMQLERRFRVVPLSEISGEWRIVKVLGEKFPTIQEVPFVNFDIENSRVYAYAGCNRLSAGFKKGEKANEMTISNVLSTRMACPDMSAEQNTIQALEQVSRFAVSNNGNLMLFSAGGDVVLELMRNK